MRVSQGRQRFLLMNGSCAIASVIRDRMVTARQTRRQQPSTFCIVAVAVVSLALDTWASPLLEIAMLVVMHRDATPPQIEQVLAAIRRMNLTPHPMPGATRTAIGITG